MAWLLMSVLVGFGALAGLLAALDVYGLFAWESRWARRELAIRLTLGATPRSVTPSVIRQSARLVVARLVVGVVLVQASDALLTRVLYGIQSSDPAAIAGAAVVLLVAALGACLPAAWRAKGVEPAAGLRAE